MDPRFRLPIVAASAITPEAWRRIGTSSTAPKPETFDEMTLTAELLLLRLPPRRTTNEGQGSFHWLSDGPAKPIALASEMTRGNVRLGRFWFPLRPVTMIQADRITHCRADVHGDTARGTFRFRVPDLYEGDASFVAQRRGQLWKVVEFRMESAGIHIARGEDGRWRRVK